jgi:hypothetical protein
LTFKGRVEKPFAGRRIVFGSLFLFTALMVAGGMPGASKTLSALQNSSAPVFSFSESTNPAAETPHAAHNQIQELAAKMSPHTPRGAIAVETAMAVASGSALDGRYTFLSQPKRESSSASLTGVSTAPAQAAPILITEVDTARAIAPNTRFDVRDEHWTSLRRRDRGIDYG